MIPENFLCDFRRIFVNVFHRFTKFPSSQFFIRFWIIYFKSNFLLRFFRIYLIKAFSILNEFFVNWTSILIFRFFNNRTQKVQSPIKIVLVKIVRAQLLLQLSENFFELYFFLVQYRAYLTLITHRDVFISNLTVLDVEIHILRISKEPFYVWSHWKTSSEEFWRSGRR